MDEKDLIRRAKQGDRQAFGQLVRMCQPMVYRTVLRILGNEDDAMDITQEGFIRAFTRFEGFREASSFSTWVCRIAMNLALNLLRDRKPTVDPDVASLSTPAFDVISSRADAQFQARLSKAIEELPPKQRLTLLLRVKDAKSHLEIADTLGCAVGTSKANYHNAVMNLRKALSDLLPSEECVR